VEREDGVVQPEMILVFISQVSGRFSKYCWIVSILRVARSMKEGQTKGRCWEFQPWMDQRTWSRLSHAHETRTSQAEAGYSQIIGRVCI